MCHPICWIVRIKDPLLLTGTTGLEPTIGHRQVLAKVMVKEAIVTGLKSKILGYMSKGDRV